MQTLTHYFLHFGFIFLIAYLIDKNNIKQVYLILLASMLVDLDHLLADPIFDPKRCSINFHLLHTYWAWALYLLVAFLAKNKMIKTFAIGLSFHLFTDAIDCLWSYNWDFKVLL